LAWFAMLTDAEITPTHLRERAVYRGLSGQITPTHLRERAVYRALSGPGRKRRRLNLDSLDEANGDHLRSCCNTDCAVCKIALKEAECTICTEKLGDNLFATWRCAACKQRTVHATCWLRTAMAAAGAGLTPTCPFCRAEYKFEHCTTPSEAAQPDPAPPPPAPPQPERPLSDDEEIPLMPGSPNSLFPVHASGSVVGDERASSPEEQAGTSSGSSSGEDASSDDGQDAAEAEAERAARERAEAGVFWWQS